MGKQKFMALVLILALGLSLTPAWADSSYSDVLPGQWYTDGVNFAIDHQLFKLDSDKEFGLNHPVTRSEMVYALWMLYRQPQAESSREFSDLPADAYYYAAIQWAASAGITSGMGNGQFGVNQLLTREQTVTFLENMNIYLKCDLNEDTNILSYEDFDQISEYAIGPFQWACGEGIITGTSPSTLSPKGLLTRSQLSVILLKFYSTRDSGENTFGFNVEPALIQLEGNATTGFAWYADKFNESLFAVEELNYITSEPNLPGSGGTFQFQVTGLKPGTDTLSFLYYRSWEGKDQAIDRAVYEINVADNGQVTAIKMQNEENTSGFNSEPALIQLEGNATTGFGWYVTKSDEDLYTVNELDYMPDNPDVEGSPGIFQFQVTGLKPGAGELCFTYYRPWEEQQPDNQQVIFQIIVTPDGKVTANQI